MGPTKVIVKNNALYEAKSGKLTKEGLATPEEQKAYAAHHYIALPVRDNAGKTWLLDGKTVYCLHGAVYETVDDEVVHLSRCPDCGGMGIRMEEMTIERDCIYCTQCHHEFDSRLEMMES